MEGLPTFSDMKEQVCNICEELKPIIEFEWQSNRPNPRKTCKTCRAKKQWSDIKGNPVKHSHYNSLRKQWRLKNFKKLSHQWKKSEYKLGEGEYQRMLDDQGYICAICDKLLLDDKNTHIDHDHKTGRVRAILCTNCNIGLGMFKDDPAVLKRAVGYVHTYELGGELDWLEPPNYAI